MKVLFFIIMTLKLKLLKFNRIFSY